MVAQRFRCCETSPRRVAGAGSGLPAEPCRAPRGSTGYAEAAVPEAYKDVPRWEKPFRPGDLAKALPRLVQKS
jgi:hypothetical protein